MARPALDQLADCLQGRPPAACDWTTVIGVANRGLVTPQLAAALEPLADSLPPGVWGFLEEVRARNRERDGRLRRQLADALAVLNAAGIEPVLLKGAALWAAFPDEPSDRILTDLDLLVRPEEVEAALEVLDRAGFGLVGEYGVPSAHVVATLGRPQDPGVLDLHRRPPGPPGLSDAPELSARRRRVALAGGAAWAPDAAAQILHLVLHDQFHDGDYWRGGFDLRHAADITRLAPELAPEDWTWLHGACRSRLMRAALDAQLLAAQSVFGGDFPVGAGGRAGRTVARWRLQSRFPLLRPALAGFVLATEWRDVAAHGVIVRSERERALGAPRSDRFAPRRRMRRLRKILTPLEGKT